MIQDSPSNFKQDSSENGDMIYKELIKDMTWSFSRIECFNSCAYRWFLKYIKNYKDVPQFYSSYGSFMHKLIERFYKGELTKEEMQTKFLFDFSKEVQGIRPQESTVQKYIKAGLNYLKHFKPFPFEMVAVEEKVEFEIDGIPFVGYIDYHGIKDGEHYIVDNKSRDLKPRSNRKTPTVKDKELDEMLRQLYIYSAAIKQKYGKFPKALCFNCFKTGTFIEEPFKESAYNESIKWAKENISNIIKTNRFPPSIDFFSCCYICGVNDECCYWEAR